jgi:hypothetical protein
MNFVGPWPSAVRPQAFAGDALALAIRKLHAHITGPYPVQMLQLSDTPPGPAYQMVDGKIARSSSPFIDMLICAVIPRHEISSQEPHIVVWRLIEKHAASPLAKLIFTLPRIAEASKAAHEGKTAILVIEDIKIQVYKGVENILFGVYEDLPEGGYLSDSLVEQKMRSLLPS